MPRPRLMKRLFAKVASARAGHRLRHRPSGFGLALADRIGYLDAAAWDRTVKDATWFLSRAYLDVLERTAPGNLRMRYALVYRGDAPVAAAMMQLLALPASRVMKAGKDGESMPAPGPVRTIARAAQKIRDGALDKVRAPLLVCGNLLTWGFHGVAFAPGEDPALLWPGVAEALYRVRRAERLSGQTDFVMIKDVTPGEAAPARSLATYGYRPHATEPNMVLEIRPTWRSYDDYLAGLTADYRRSARKLGKEIEAAGGHVERIDDLAPVAARIQELYRNVLSRAAVRPITLSPDYLPVLAAAAGDRFRCTVVRRGREILGFVTTVKDGDTAIGYFVGVDYAANAEIPVYLRLLHATIADAIELGCRRLSLGRTALEPKARLGAKPEPTEIWLRHRVPAANVLLQALLRGVHHDQAPERSPFRGV